MCGPKAIEYRGFCRTSCIQSNYSGHVFRSLGTFYFDNRILTVVRQVLKELAWFCLLNVNCLLDKRLSLIQDIGKIAYIYSILKGHKETFWSLRNLDFDIASDFVLRAFHYLAIRDSRYAICDKPAGGNFLNNL